MSEFPVSQEEMKKRLIPNAKGRDVFELGTGLTYVADNPERVDVGFTNMAEKTGWVVGGVVPNYNDGEVGIFVFPATDILPDGLLND